MGTSSLWLVYLLIYTLGLISLVRALEVPVERARLARVKDCN